MCYTILLSLLWPLFLVCSNGLSFSLSCRWEALPVFVGRLWVEVRSIRRTHPPLQETHGCQALQVPPLRALLLPLRSPGTPHEEAPVRSAKVSWPWPLTVTLTISQHSKTSTRSTSLYLPDVSVTTLLPRAGNELVSFLTSEQQWPQRDLSLL